MLAREKGNRIVKSSFKMCVSTMHEQINNVCSYLMNKLEYKHKTNI